MAASAAVHRMEAREEKLMTVTELSSNEQATNAFAERIFAASTAALELGSIHLGLKLGLYDALHAGPLTAAELSHAAGVHERYAREWLEQQAAAGVLTVASQEGTEGTYALPEAHRPVLLEPEHPAYVGALAHFHAGVSRVLAEVVQAYRSGGGVAYAQYGADTRAGIALVNRPMFTNDLPDWLRAAVPQLAGRLAEHGGRVLDVACGVGWSSIALAHALPAATVDGVDLDTASIDEARDNAAEAGLGEQVSFRAEDAARLTNDHHYDLVTLFEGLHDMADPVGALAAIRSVLAADGMFLLAEENVAEEFVAPAGELERFLYGCSVLHCLPATMAEDPVDATGTCLRPSTLRQYAARAGFADIDTVPIEHDFWRFYLLK